MKFSIPSSFILASSFVSVAFGSRFKAPPIKKTDDYSGHYNSPLKIETMCLNGQARTAEADQALQYHGYASRLYMALQEAHRLGHNEPLKRLAEYERNMSDRTDIRQ